MRVMVALENRFLKTKSGNIYSTTVCDYNFWCRYLQVFDEVVVLARVAEIAENKLGKPPANGPHVSFLSLPAFIGPGQFLRQYRKINGLVKGAVSEADAFLLRTPGTVATLLWRHLRKHKIPYGIEVLGDPWEVLQRGSVRSVFRPIIRRRMRLNLARQCRSAIAAAYVTEFTLQKNYPPGYFSTHYSSIELPDEKYIEEEKLAARLVTVNDAIMQKRPLKICHMGTMSGLYKGQDILMEAVSLCRKMDRDIKLNLLGEGKYYQYYLDIARKFDLLEHVNFLGQLPPGQAVIKQLDLADLFVLPSLTEGLPRSLIEAMARGLPCLASKVGGIPELLDDEYLFPVKDAGALAEKIESLFIDQGKIEGMARRNLQEARKYCTENLNSRRRTLYRKLREETEEWYTKRSSKSREV